MNLFGEEFDPQKNPCCESEKPKQKEGKKSKSTVESKPSGLEEKLPSRTIQVKMYSDFYHYEAPEGLEEPTLNDVRKFMVNTHGFTELTDEKRAGLTIITPEGEGEEPYVFCGVKFEKMG